MIVELKADVKVPKPKGGFYLLRAGRRVNYSSSGPPQEREHVLRAVMGDVVVEYRERGDPKWL